MDSSKCLSTQNRSSETIELSFECFQYKIVHDWKFLLLSVIFLLLITLDIFANLIVFASIVLEKSKKRVDLCFMSNAIADLIMGLVIMPFTAMYTLFGYFPFGPAVCFIWNVMDFTAGTASMLHIAFISYDRYLSVSKPYTYTQKSSEKFSVTGIPTSLILVFIWFFASAAWIPAILYFKSQNQQTFTNYFDLLNITSSNRTSHLTTVDPLDDDIILDNCNLIASPTIVLPHTFIVYFLPMFLIVLFYSKTISMVNQKVKRRRTSLISSKYSSTLMQQASQFSLQTQLAQANIKSKNLFNLSGRNKQESTNTLAQHMKTINMFSVYFLVQPKTPSEKQTTTSLNKSIVEIDENQQEESSKDESSLINNNTNTIKSNTNQELTTLPQIKEPETTAGNYLRVGEIKSTGDGSSSFNSTTSTRISSSVKCAADETNLDNLEAVSLKPTKLRQFCASLEENALISNKLLSSNEINDEQEKEISPDKPSNSKNRFYAQKIYNRSLNSNLAKLTHLNKSKTGSINKLYRCSDLSRLNLDNNDNDDEEDGQFCEKSGVEPLEMSNSIEMSSNLLANESLGNEASEVEEMPKVSPTPSPITNGILKRPTETSFNQNISNNNTNETTVNGGTGVNKMLSFKISRDLEEMTNGIRLASNSNKREKNVTYKLGLIMITFIVSWLPFCILWPLVSVCSKCVSEPIYIFSFWLAYLNSVFTPIILLYNNVKYRKSIVVFGRFFLLKPFNFLFGNKNNINYNSNNNHANNINQPPINNNITTNVNNNENCLEVATADLNGQEKSNKARKSGLILNNSKQQQQRSNKINS